MDFGCPWLYSNASQENMQIANGWIVENGPCDLKCHDHQVAATDTTSKSTNTVTRNTAQDTSWLQHWSICPLSEVYTNQNLPYGMHIPTNTHLLSLWFMSIVLTKWVMEKYIIPPVITAAIIDKFQYYNKWVATDLECVCQNNNITHEQKCFLAWLQSWLGLACFQ